MLINSCVEQGISDRGKIHSSTLEGRSKSRTAPIPSSTYILEPKPDYPDTEDQPFTAKQVDVKEKRQNTNIGTWENVEVEVAQRRENKHALHTRTLEKADQERAQVRIVKEAEQKLAHQREKQDVTIMKKLEKAEHELEQLKEENGQLEDEKRELFNRL